MFERPWLGGRGWVAVVGWPWLGGRGWSEGRVKPRNATLGIVGFQDMLVPGLPLLRSVQPRPPELTRCGNVHGAVPARAPCDVPFASS